MRILVAILLLPITPLACSCFNSANACTDQREIVFVGRVIVDSGEGWGDRPARLQVEEVLRGLEPKVREVEVNSSFGNSCYIPLKKDERYVIFSSRSGSSQTLSTAQCSNTFNLRGKEHILDAMRNAYSGGPPRLVGTVLKSTGRYAREPGVMGATVSLEKDGITQSVSSDSQGNYEFRALPPGRYQVTVARPGFVPDEEFNNRWSGRMRLNTATRAIAREDAPRGTVLVESRSCEIWDVALWPNGRISGTVRDRSGVAMSGIRIQVLGLDKKGTNFDSLAIREVKTNLAGQYSVDRLPQGPYLVGVNIQKFHDDDVYPTTFYPSARIPEQAAQVSVGESEEVTGIDITLPPPRKPKEVGIRVEDEKGNPLAGVRVFLLNLQGVERAYSKGTDSKGFASITVYEGEKYILRARSYRERQFLVGETKLEDPSGSSPVIVVRPRD